MSTLKADTIQSTSGGAATLTKQSAAKAWINYNQSSDAVRDSFNITSTSDDGVGNKRHSMTNSMSNADYSIVGMTQGDGGDSRNRFINLGNFNGAGEPTSSSYETQTYAISGFSSFTDTDDDYTCSTVHGDLA